MENPHSAKSSVGADELRATVALAVPVVLVQLGFMLMGVVDTLMVGRVSARVLAAVALGNLYYFNVTILATGSLMALDPIVAQAVGAGESESVARAMQRGLIIAAGFCVLCALCIAPAPTVLTTLRQPPEIVPDASTYLRISLIGLAPYLVFVVLRQSLQAMHRVAPIVWTVIVANLSNAGFNWVFVYGHFGSPALGAAGSAIATAISRWLMLLLLLAGAWRELRPLMFPVRDEIGSWPALSQMLRIGLPIGAQQGLEAAAFGAIGLLMGVLGTIEMAAHQVAITLAAFTFMVPLGVGSATAVRVGRAIGAADMPRARAAIRASYLCGVGFMAITAIAFIWVPHLLAAAFTPDVRVIALASTLIPIAGVFQMFDGGQAVGAGVLRGAGDTKAPLVTMLASYWLFGVPVSAYLGFRTSLGAAGLWWGFVVSLAGVAIFLFLRIRVVFAQSVGRVREQ
ncbi:MAG TPA: MATE family efflux transporter [Gemmatimonadaceae bacterium]|jgi:MATE family multidrug resistance protein|nr:MATE family efflux transporter [Gemmatimonadaceae bacterium]